MVTAVTNLGRNGLSDWMVQRISAVVLLAYVVFIVGFLVCSDNLDYASWQALFAHTCMRIFSLAALLSLVTHAWIGLWSISTDYLIEYVMTLKMGPAVGAKANLLRWVFQVVSAILLFVYLVWGAQILWS